MDIPFDNAEKTAEVKATLKSTKRPYKRFDGFYKLESIIEM